jgi:hypothetical protein
MTNPFLKAEVNTAMQEIQENANQVRNCLKLEKCQSLLLATFLYHQKDIRSTFRNGLQFVIESGTTTGTEQCSSKRYSNQE